MERPNLSELTKKIDDCKTSRESVNAVVDYVGKCEIYISLLEKALDVMCKLAEKESLEPYERCEECYFYENCPLESRYDCLFSDVDYKNIALSKAEEELKGETE